MAQVSMHPSARMTEIDLGQGPYARDFYIINDARAPSSGMKSGGDESYFLPIATLLFLYLPIIFY